MNLDLLAGNASLKKQLSAQESGRGLSHAYLISGAPGTGRKTLARLMARAMLCTGGGDKPCGACPACRKTLAGIHPDLITVEGEKGKDITVGQIRALRADAYIRPNEGARKVYLIPEAQSMNVNAQNAVLKLLWPPCARRRLRPGSASVFRTSLPTFFGRRPAPARGYWAWRSSIWRAFLRRTPPPGPLWT